MRSETLPPAVLVVILVVVLLLAAALGAAWGHAMPALAIAACGEIVVLLWLLLRRPADRHRIAGTTVAAAVPPLGHRVRWRRLAAQLRDVRDTVDALPDAVVLLDREGGVRWSNPAAERLLGLRRPTDGQPLAARLAGSEFGAWLRDGAPPLAGDLPAPVDPSLRLSAASMPFGSQLQLLLARDISTVSRLEQVRRDFVANVSHELRTPLTVIHGYLELLDPRDVPELAPVLQEMRAQSHRMGQIVEDLLTLSRLETRDALPDEHVAMTPLLASLRREAEALSHSRHTVNLEAATDADLRGSAKDLRSAFSNLVSNAVRYTPSGGSITITWQRTADGGAAFSVRDTGLGIPAQHQLRLSERFYRVSSSRSRESGGTGLGLSIVKHVLNLHQARLVIESAPGKGSTFACVFDADRVLESGGDKA